MDRKQYLVESLAEQLGDLPTKDRVLAEYRRILDIEWLKPMQEPPKGAEAKVRLACKLFGVEAEIEYRTLKTTKDWGAARDAAWDAARDAAWDAARDAARDAAWGAARDAARGAAWGAARGAAWDAARGAAWGAARGAAWDAAWDAAWGAAWDAARGAATECVMDLESFTKKYPENPFKVLADLWAMGFYVVGIVKGKFVLYYVPHE